MGHRASSRIGLFHPREMTIRQMCFLALVAALAVIDAIPTTPENDHIVPENVHSKLAGASIKEFVSSLVQAPGNPNWKDLMPENVLRNGRHKQSPIHNTGMASKHGEIKAAGQRTVKMLHSKSPYKNKKHAPRSLLVEYKDVKGVPASVRPSAKKHTPNHNFRIHKPARPERFQAPFYRARKQKMHERQMHEQNTESAGPKKARVRQMRKHFRETKDELGGPEAFNQYLVQQLGSRKGERREGNSKQKPSKNNHKAKKKENGSPALSLYTMKQFAGWRKHLARSPHKPAAPKGYGRGGYGRNGYGRGGYGGYGGKGAYAGKQGGYGGGYGRGGYGGYPTAGAERRAKLRKQHRRIKKERKKYLSRSIDRLDGVHAAFNDF